MTVKMPCNFIREDCFENREESLSLEVFILVARSSVSESLPSGLGAKRKVECTAVKAFHVSIFSLASPLCARSLLLNRQATQVSQEPENKWPSGFPRSNIAFQAVEKSEVPFKEDIFAKKVLEYQFSL